MEVFKRITANMEKAREHRIERVIMDLFLSNLISPSMSCTATTTIKFDAHLNTNYSDGQQNNSLAIQKSPGLSFVLPRALDL